MPSPPSLVQLVPDKNLEIPVVLYKSITVSLRIENTTSSRVAFKIKTTAPKTYLVKPSTGLLDDREAKTVEIILQPLKELPKEACSDRFLVQATKTTNSEPLSREEWNQVEKSDIQDLRLSVQHLTDSASPVPNDTGLHTPPNGAGVLPSAPAANATSDSKDVAKDSAKEGGSQMAEKYSDLASYSKSLELRYSELKKKVDTQPNDRPKAAPRAAPQVISTGIELYHVIIITLVILGILKLFKFL
eukprot:Platyproteum_vivax@DN12343_c0_g1_i1.p1